MITFISYVIMYVTHLNSFYYPFLFLLPSLLGINFSDIIEVNIRSFPVPPSHFFFILFHIDFLLYYESNACLWLNV